MNAAALEEHGQFRWGVVGPGRIAHTFAAAVAALPGMRLVAVAGRTPAAAHAFASRWSAPEAPVSAEADALALLARGDLDAVYVATPHSAHAAVVAECLRAGVPVLCEKPLVATGAQARCLAALARERRVFLMEALWSRFLPVYDVVRAWLAGGRIGVPHAIAATLCYREPYDPHSRLYDPARAGGALLDFGVYALSMVRWAAATAHGRAPAMRVVAASGVRAPSGVDARVAAQLEFADGTLAHVLCAFDTDARNGLWIHGSQGSVTVHDDFWRGARATLRRRHEPALHVERPFAPTGFEGQIVEVVERVRRSELESPRMPLAESVAVAECMDDIRARLGVRYPFETADHE